MENENCSNNCNATYFRRCTSETVNKKNTVDMSRESAIVVLLQFYYFCFNKRLHSRLQSKTVCNSGAASQPGEGPRGDTCPGNYFVPLTTFFAPRWIVSSCGISVPVSGVTKYGSTYQRCPRISRCSRSWTSPLRTTQ